MSEIDEKMIAGQEELAEEKAEASETAEAEAAEAETAQTDEAAEAAEDDYDAELFEAASVDAIEQPKKKKTGLIIGLVALGLALAGGGYYYYATYMAPAAASQEPEAVETEMPDLMYESAEVAEGILAERGIAADVIYVSSEKVPKGLVTLQSVSAGLPVEGDVVIYISMGPAPTPTPEPSPLPTPTPKVTPRPKRTPVPEIVVPMPVETPCG